MYFFYQLYTFSPDVLPPTVRLSSCSKNMIVDEKSFRRKKSDSHGSPSTPRLPPNVSPSQKVERWLEKTAFENAVSFLFFYFTNSLALLFCARLEYNFHKQAYFVHNISLNLNWGLIMK